MSKSMVGWRKCRSCQIGGVGGLELATLVFMNLAEDEDGDVEIEVKYSEMPLKLLTPDMA